MDFDDVMRLTRTVSSSTAFEDEECRAYYDTLMRVNEGGTIVEVGLEYGRSSSIALQVAREKYLRYIGIDPVITQIWLTMSAAVEVDVTLCKMFSHDFTWVVPINAVLIDGDHTYAAIENDCAHFLPMVVSGGYAMFHDYGRDSLPDVYAAVNRYMEVHDGEWLNVSHIRTAGTLGIWRRMP